MSPTRTNPLEEAFHEAMLKIYVSAKKECKYNATRFLQMVNEQGGLQAARSLIHAHETSDGFRALWERGRLDLTVEALVLKSPWRPLFTNKELTIAKRRLEELDFDPESETDRQES